MDVLNMHPTAPTAPPPERRLRLTPARAAKEAKMVAMVAMHQRMIAAFEANGEITANWATEVLAVARAAASQGEFMAALKGYELIAKRFNLIVDKPSQHLHVHQGGAQMTTAEIVRATDDELRAQLVALAKPMPALPPPAAHDSDPLVSAAVDPLADDELFS